MTAPATTVGLYRADEAGHTPTRWTASSAWTAWLQLVNEVRSGMATNGGPDETTTSMVEPSLALTVAPAGRGPPVAG